MSDIVERLREHAEQAHECGSLGWRDTMNEAADTITVLQEEVERLRTSGIAEAAAHNPSVMDYVRHWEGRTLKAEAKDCAVRAAIIQAGGNDE